MCIRDSFKPDFAPDYLNCCNYICHFSVFQKALFDAVGGLDPALSLIHISHGFLVLSEEAEFTYKCTDYYDPAA